MLIGVALGSSSVHASEDPLAADDYVAPRPAEFDHIQITEKLGDTAALEASFVDDEGRSVTLADYTGGDLPIILTFNYSSCPMLCSIQLNALVTTLQESAFVAGKQFQIVTIVLDPAQTTETSADKKAGYVGRFVEERREFVGAGWHFLTGTKASVDAVAESVGFGYDYDEKRDEYLHPATLVFLSSDGIVTRYVHGLHYELVDLNRSILDAGAAKQGGAVGFFQACFQYEPPSSYSRMGERTMRYGALGFVVFFFAALLLWQYLRSRKATGTESPS
jgi:protein SCO1/2